MKEFLGRLGINVAKTIGYLAAVLLLAGFVAMPVYLLDRSSQAGALAMCFAALAIRWRRLGADGLRLTVRAPIEWSAGVVLGGLLLAVTMGGVWAAGAVSFALPKTQVSINAVAAWFGFFAVQSMGEELIVRGYIQRLWTENFNLPTGLIVASLIFAAAHIPNDGFNRLAGINTVGSGLLLGIVYARTRSLWVSGGIHAGWNFVQPLLDASVSGNAVRYPIVVTKFDGTEAWTGGYYGIEASLPCTIVLVVLIIGAWFVRWPHPQPAESAILADNQPEDATCSNDEQH